MLKYAEGQIKAPTLQTAVHKQCKAHKESHWIAQWEDQQHQATEPWVCMVWAAMALTVLGWLSR